MCVTVSHLVYILGKPMSRTNHFFHNDKPALIRHPQNMSRQCFQTIVKYGQVMLLKGHIEGSRSEIILIPVPVGTRVVYTFLAALFDASENDPSKQTKEILEVTQPCTIFWVVGGATMVEGFCRGPQTDVWESVCPSRSARVPNRHFV